MPTKCEIWVDELKALKLQTPSLKQNMDNISPLLLSYISSFISNYGQYNCGEDLVGSVQSFKNLIQSDSYNSPSFVTSTINTIQFDAGACKGGSTNCSKTGCEGSVASMNIAINNYFNARKALVSNILSISNKESQIANDLECKKAQDAKTDQDAIDQDKNRQLRNTIIGVIVVGAVIATLAWLDKKYFHIFLK